MSRTAERMIFGVVLALLVNFAYFQGFWKGTDVGMCGQSIAFATQTGDMSNQDIKNYADNLPPCVRVRNNWFFWQSV